MGAGLPAASGAAMAWQAMTPTSRPQARADARRILADNGLFKTIYRADLRRQGSKRYHSRLFRTFLWSCSMKAEIHPKYAPVIFQDVSSNFAFLTRSTMTAKETMKWDDGKEYPVIKVEISSKSHPFYTGKHKIVDAGGRVDKFRKRYGAK
jgi:large subunit ribosomal protein L31